MSWRAAFLAQAVSDNAARKLFNDRKSEYCHQLHYLQMVTEKLSKGLELSENDTEPPGFTHLGFVRLLQTLKSNPTMRRRLGYEGQNETFRHLIDAVLPLAREIERLAPSSAHGTLPNPEYPWRDRGTGTIVAPLSYQFAAFSPSGLAMVQLESLLSKLLAIAITELT